jgi:ribosomal protein S18 acetylase RimI-like enzyme
MNTPNEVLTAIREARCGDAAGIARVHVESWRTTYRGQVPDEYLASLSIESRMRFWEPLTCGYSGPEFVFVAENNTGQIVGFASGGPERSGNPDYKGELYAIYLLQGAQGRGLGRQLADKVMERLQTNGYDSMLLWVLATNPARKFYEALGGQYVDSQTIRIGGAALVEVAYGWMLVL